MPEQNGFSFNTGSGFSSATVVSVRRITRCRCGATRRIRLVRGYGTASVYRCERCDATDRLRESWNATRRLPRRLLAWYRTR